MGHLGHVLVANYISIGVQGVVKKVLTYCVAILTQDNGFIIDAEKRDYESRIVTILVADLQVHNFHTVDLVCGNELFHLSIFGVFYLIQIV